MKEEEIHSIINFVSRYCSHWLIGEKLRKLNEEILEEDIDIRLLDYKRGMIKGCTDITDSLLDFSFKDNVIEYNTAAFINFKEAIKVEVNKLLEEKANIEKLEKSTDEYISDDCPF